MFKFILMMTVFCFSMLLQTHAQANQATVNYEFEVTIISNEVVTERYQVGVTPTGKKIRLPQLFSNYNCTIFKAISDSNVFAHYISCIDVYSNTHLFTILLCTIDHKFDSSSLSLVKRNHLNKFVTVSISGMCKVDSSTETSSSPKSTEL